MSAQRKTVKRGVLVANLNRALAADAGLTDRERLHLAGLVESVLMDSNTYAGFGYLPSELDDRGQLRPGHNDSRRRYY